MEPPTAIKTILVVDDNAKKRETIVELSRLAYPQATILQAASPLGGLLALQQHNASIDLVLTDLSMLVGPEVTLGESAGFAVAQAAKHFAPKSTVLILTSEPGSKAFTNAIAAGADGLLSHLDFPGEQGLAQAVDEIAKGRVICSDRDAPQIVLDMGVAEGELRQMDDDLTISSLPKPWTLSSSRPDLFQPRLPQDRESHLRALVEIAIWRQRLDSAAFRNAFRRGSADKTGEAAVTDGLANVRLELSQTSIDVAVSHYLSKPPVGGLPVDRLRTALLFQVPNGIARYVSATGLARERLRQRGETARRDLEALHFRAPRRGFGRLQSRMPGDVATPDEALKELSQIDVPAHILGAEFSIDEVKGLLERAQPSFVALPGLGVDSGKSTPRMDER